MLWLILMAEKSMQRKQHIVTRRDSSFCPSLWYISVSIRPKCQSYVHLAPYWLLAILFHWFCQACLAGHFQAEWITVSVSLMSLPCIAVGIYLALKTQRGDLNWLVLAECLNLSVSLLLFSSHHVLSSFVGSCVVSSLLCVSLFPAY